MAVSALVDVHHFLEVDGVEEEKKDEEDGSEAGEEEEEKEAEHGEQIEQAEEGVTEEEEMVLEAPKTPFFSQCFCSPGRRRCRPGRSASSGSRARTYSSAPADL